MKLYKSTTGLVHWVRAGYICKLDIGKVESNMEGDRYDLTCKNCIGILN